MWGEELNKVFICRMTHIENIPHIIKNGITHRDSPNSNPYYISIGDNTLINRRDSFTKNGIIIRDYIPFYFGAAQPMLYVILNGYNGVKKISPEDIAYFKVSVQSVIDNNREFIFTDGHIVNNISRIFKKEDLGNIGNLVDINAALIPNWHDNDDIDKKRRKQAEFLVKGDLPFSTIERFATYNDRAKNKLIQFGIKASIKVRPDLYFNDDKARNR